MYLPHLRREFFVILILFFIYVIFIQTKSEWILVLFLLRLLLPFFLICIAVILAPVVEFSKIINLFCYHHGLALDFRIFTVAWFRLVLVHLELWLLLLWRIIFLGLLFFILTHYKTWFTLALTLRVFTCSSLLCVGGCSFLLDHDFLFWLDWLTRLARLLGRLLSWLWCRTPASLFQNLSVHSAETELRSCLVRRLYFNFFWGFAFEVSGCSPNFPIFRLISIIPFRIEPLELPRALRCRVKINLLYFERLLHSELDFIVKSILISKGRASVVKHSFAFRGEQIWGT